MRRFVVDRLEGGTAVLVDEQGLEHDVPAAALPGACRSEGAILSVPENSGSVLDWSKATRDHAEEQRLLAEAGERLKRLRRRDPGGDVTL